jgi:hypothetical protein
MNITEIILSMMSVGSMYPLLASGWLRYYKGGVRAWRVSE